MGNNENWGNVMFTPEDKTEINSRYLVSLIPKKMDFIALLHWGYLKTSLDKTWAETPEPIIPWWSPNSFWGSKRGQLWQEWVNHILTGVRRRKTRSSHGPKRWAQAAQNVLIILGVKDHIDHLLEMLLLFFQLLYFKVKCNFLSYYLYQILIM